MLQIYCQNLLQSLFYLLIYGELVASYVLVDDYSGANFFSGFSFFTGPDPTRGFVRYVDAATASNTGLTSITTGSDGKPVVHIGVDSQNVMPGGRSSVRITSNKAYNHGVVITDIAHMPGSICGTWPAFWMVGPNWPVSREIDILEGVNDQKHNFVTFHTGTGCSILNSLVGSIMDTVNTLFTGALKTLNCDVQAPNQGPNQGCQVANYNRASYGNGFNAVGGGVYATEWTSQTIRIWFFSRAEGIPQDIVEGRPDPATWGTPVAQLGQGCVIDQHFENLNVVFDNTFCGDWAGAAWSSTPSCAANFVANNPQAFAEAYWAINYVRVFS
ncbi:hypothetical protein VTN00DRAFT_6392 [Thermoascus crustaceus]|uniref:uncharacterized protein n=1 Tax=Thermoascus crustaceus TaxID=5088 RepID=UPI0037445787